MRFNPQEVMGSRVRLRYSVELHFDALAPAEFLLNVHAARTNSQQVVEEQFELLPDCAHSVAADPVSGNRIDSFRVDSGRVTAKYGALVDIRHRIVDPQDVIAESPAALPVSAMPFLYSSRYCQADLVQQRVWDRFGALPRGYSQVRAVRDWIRKDFRFRVGVSNGTTSALETMRDGAGVCRDFAHVMIACCRALNYPARFVTGVDYGADPALGPPDFHAYVEVFVGGAWYLFEPTGISPVTGLVRIGTGRDAADVSFATMFGPVRTHPPRIQFATVHDPDRGFVAPTDTELAVSTAD
jgi:transglutaminase-like putative cysteine protease